MPRNPQPRIQPGRARAPLTSSETRIIQVLLAGTLDPLPGLLAQLPHTRVLQRTQTEWGPWIDLWVAPRLQRVTPAHFQVSDVRLTFEESPDHGGACLFVHDGQLSALEILAAVPVDFHLRKIRYERMLESDDPSGMPEFVIVDRRAVDLVAADIEEARGWERSEAPSHHHKKGRRRPS